MTPCRPAPPQQIFVYAGSRVRTFDHPQPYKHFVNRCEMVEGDGDDENRVLSFRVVEGGYGSVTLVSEVISDANQVYCVVMKFKYQEGNSLEDTRMFVIKSLEIMMSIFRIFCIILILN